MAKSSPVAVNEYFEKDTIQQCGYIMATMAVIMLVGGATVETLSFAKYYGEFPQIPIDSSYTFISYGGYWCSVLILLGSIVAIYSADHQFNNVIAANFTAALFVLTFAVVSISLSASEWNRAETANTLCKNCSAGQMMLAAYGVIIASGSIAVLGASLLGAACIQTHLMGRSKISVQSMTAQHAADSSDSSDSSVHKSSSPADMIENTAADSNVDF